MEFVLCLICEITRLISTDAGESDKQTVGSWSSSFILYQATTDCVLLWSLESSQSSTSLHIPIVQSSGELVAL